MKVPPFLSTKDKILEANEYTRDLDTAFAKVRETLQKSQERQKKAAYCHQRDLKLKENDWITEQINDISFRLRLPDTWKIHNFPELDLAHKVTKKAPKVPALGIVGRLYAAEPLNACQPVKSMNSNDISGFLLLERGDCSFVTKVKHAQAAGYTAAIVYNDEDGDLITMSGTETGIAIYAVFVTKKAGEILQSSVDKSDSRCYILPMFENAAKSFVAIIFLSFLTVFAILSTLFFARRHRYHRAIAETQARGMAWKDVKALTVVLYGNGSEEFTTTCAICLEDYKQGERLRVLPCGHEFHVTCIDQWLTTQRCFCPVCKTDARSKSSRKVPSEHTPLLASYTPNFNAMLSAETSSDNEQFVPIRPATCMPESFAASATPCSCSPSSRMLASDTQEVAILVSSD
ncbi:hypothetical protein L7F22_012289 [Adiantum nelumboides]|nr:hypothetical protein [Adiantum nelumboides]